MKNQIEPNDQLQTNNFKQIKMATMRNQLPSVALAVAIVTLLLAPQGELYSQTSERESRTADNRLSELGNIHGRKVSASPNPVITVDLRDVPLDEALKEVARLAESGLYFNSELLPARRVTRSFDKMPLNRVLQELLADTPVEAYASGRNIMLRMREMSYAEETPAREVLLQSLITGLVTDSRNGEPLPGANVSIQGTTRGSSTDADGRYQIPNVEPGSYTLVASYIGYQETTRSITVQPGQETVTVDIALQPSALALDELVVIGYGQQRRSNLTGAIASVRAEEITAVTSGGVQEVLQGRVAGVVITPTSGQPGGAIDMNIRGVATFGSGQPLYVIDGVPVLSEESSRNFNPLATLNPDNIQSIEILKDASASAIYGARAANGVVLITTNRGFDRPTQLSIKTSGGVSTVSDRYPMMSTEQWIPYSREAYSNAGRPIPVAFEEPLLSQNLQRNTNWQDEAYSTSLQQNYWIGLSGGSQNANYSISGGHLDQEGTLPNSRFNRTSVRVNSDFRVGERLRIGETVELSRARWTGLFNPASFFIRQLLQQAPTVPVYNPDALGGFDGPRLEYGPVGRQNTIGHLSLDENETIRNRALGNAYAELEIIEGLATRLNIGGEMTFAENSTFLPTFDMGDRVRTVAMMNAGNTNETAWLLESVTTWQRTISERHEVTLLAGFTQQSSWTKGIGVEVRNFPNNDLRTIEASFENRDITGNETGWALRSQMGRLNYTYDNRYNLMVTVRRDGSSRFGRNNRYGVFPSVSASWIVTNESFMNNLSLPSLSNLTIRASYGQVGSQDIANFAQYATVEQGADYTFGQETLSPGSTYLQVGNNDLRWEVTTQTNVGFDLGLFDNRLSFVFDYYVKDTDDILLQLPIPTTSGIRRNNGPFVNAGSMQNRGLELTASYQNRLGELNYVLSGNFATNRNKVTSLNQGLPIIAQLNSGKQSALTITQEGSEIGSFYGYVMEGIFRDQDDVNGHAVQPGAEPGDVKFRDLNNDGVINADDQTIIGSPFPDFTYGVNINLLFRNFDMVIFLQGKQGHDLYHLVWADLNEGEGDNNATTDMLRRWTPDNRETDIPRAVTGNPAQNTRPSSRFVEDASYLRLQNLQLGYTLPPDLSSRFGVSRLRVFVSARNLFTITNYRGYNPEIGLVNESSRSSLTRGIDFGMYPIPRTLEAGLQIDFN